MQGLLRAATAAIGLVATSAWADSNFYVSAEAGITRYDSESAEYSDPFNDGSLSNESLDRSNRSRGAVFGFQWNPNWAVEAGYAHLGEYEYSADSSGAGLYAAGNLNSEVEYEGATLAVVYRIPLSNRFALLTRLGAFDGSARKTLSDANGKNTATDDVTEGFGGVGVDLRLTEDVSGELNYFYYSGDVGVNNLNMRVQFILD